MDKGKIAELVVKAQSGDSRAMEELLRLAHTSVSYQCRKYMSNAEDAEDMTQEALIKIYKNIGSLNEPEKFLGWANRIAARQCIDALRRNPKDVQFSEDEDGHSALDDLEELDEQRVPDAALDNAETARMVQEIVDRLPEAQRTSAYLYYYSQMSVAEIAEMMGVSENTVKSRLNYARKAIKESVEEYEKDGIKLYGMSPLPFLLFFLQKSAEGGANLVAADIMAKAAIAAEGAAIAGAAGAAAGSAEAAGAAGAGGAAAGAAGSAAGAGAAAGGSAGGAAAGVLGAVSTKVVAGVVAGAVAVGGIAAAVTFSQPADEPEPTTYIEESYEPPSFEPTVEPSAEVGGSDEPAIDIPGGGDVRAEDDKDYTLSEYLATGETIWFQLEDIYIGDVVVVKEVFVLGADGSMYRMASSGLTLGDYEQMEDEEIAELVKESYEQEIRGSTLEYLNEDEETDVQQLGLRYLDADFYRGSIFAEVLTESENIEEFRARMYEEYMSGMFAAAGTSENAREGILKVTEMLYGIYAELLADGVTEAEQYVRQLFDEESPMHTPSADADFVERMVGEGLTEACAEDMLEACRFYRSIMTELRAEIAEFNENIPAGDYRIAINTDSTGSSTESMTFVYAYNYLGVTHLIDDVALTYALPAGAATSSSDYPVNDSYYGGYNAEGDMFATRVKDNEINFLLDQVGESDLPVNPETRQEMAELLGRR